jgi:hypothetical protein
MVGREGSVPPNGRMTPWPIGPYRSDVDSPSLIDYNYYSGSKVLHKILLYISSILVLYLGELGRRLLARYG